MAAWLLAISHDVVRIEKSYIKAVHYPAFVSPRRGVSYIAT